MTTQKVQLLRRNNNGQKVWNDTILDGSVWKTTKKLEEVKTFLDWHGISHIDVRLVKP